MNISDAVRTRIEEAAIRKVFRHLMWFLVLLYIMSYLDRINIGFAALSMNKDLGLTAAAFGLANSFFYITYAALEVPSNMMLAKYGARLWLSRIMISWGLAASATMFASDAVSLYVIRAIVGAAEAGALPGVLLYLSYWFPKAYKAKANAWFLTAMPLAMAIGSPLSGLLLQLDGWLGIAGWQWLFLVEGVPSVILGVFALTYLPDRPQNARWLTTEEKEALQRRLDAEQVSRPTNSQNQKASIWDELLSPKVLSIAAAWFCMVATINTLGTWSPQIVRELLDGTDDFVRVGLVGAIPPLATVFVMPFMSARSDKTGERLWHTVSMVALSVCGWSIVVLAEAAVGKMVGLTLCTIGIFSAYGIFWAMVGTVLSRETAPIGIAVITTTGIFASILSPSIVGILRDMTGGFEAGIWYAASLLLLGMVLIVLASKLPSKAIAQSAI